MEYNKPMAKQIGEQLREIREARGITIEEIAVKTRIRLEYLQAIESGDEEAIPSKVQLRGFLRLIASELGVEIEDLKIRKTGQILTAASPTISDEVTPSQDIETPSPEEEITPDDEVQHPSSETSDQPHTTSKQIENPIRLPAQITDDFVQPQDNKDLPSDKIFSEIGQTLSRRRELISLSVEDIFEILRIAPRYIHAMEAGKFDLVPSPTQAKGLLQNYADFLNLDVDAILLRYADGLQRQREEKQQEQPLRKKSPPGELSAAKLKLRNFFSLDLLVILLLFSVFAFFVVWGANRVLNSGNEIINQTDLPEVSDILLATPTPTPILTQTPEETLEEAGNGASPAEVIEEPIFTPLPNTSAINLLILPRQRVWLQVVSDSDLVFEGRIMPGNAYDFYGEDNVEILAGNAGVLQIFFNGDDIGSLGAFGQVVNLIFTRNGLVRPTATITPTITETPEVSPTPSPTPSATQTPIPTPTDFGLND